MRVLLAVVLASAVAASGPAVPPQGTRAKSSIIVDAKGDVVRFYGVPMNLKQADVKRYRYKVGHFSAEGDTYTFYTLRAEGGVEVDVQFHKGRLSSVRTSSSNAIGPRDVGVGSPLSAVQAAWPEGRVSYGIIENEAYVTFEGAEPGFMPNVDYYFDPKDMPPHAFDHFYDYEKPQVRAEVPQRIKVKTIGIFPREFREETYDFLAVTAGPCVPKIGVRMSAKEQIACKRMTPKRRYRGTWLVGFETSLFTPAGKVGCTQGKATAYCAELVGDIYFRPQYHLQCPKLYRLEFVGRRNVSPSADPAYRITVDEVLAYQPLPDPPRQPGECDETAP